MRYHILGNYTCKMVITPRLVITTAVNQGDHLKRDKRTLRPYRLMYAGSDKVIMGRWYRWLENAKDSMVVYCRRWMKVGETVEIINIRNMRLIGSCTKLVDGMRILNERQMKAEANRRRPVKLRLVA